MSDLKIGSKVSHPDYGGGVVLDAWFGNKIIKHRDKDGIISTVRVIDRSAANFAVKFSGGGPLGWAARSTNDPSDLKLVN